MAKANISGAVKAAAKKAAKTASEKVVKSAEKATKKKAPKKTTKKATGRSARQNVNEETTTSRRRTAEIAARRVAEAAEKATGRKVPQRDRSGYTSQRDAYDAKVRQSYRERSGKSSAPSTFADDVKKTASNLRDRKNVGTSVVRDEDRDGRVRQSWGRRNGTRTHAGAYAPEKKKEKQKQEDFAERFRESQQLTRNEKGGVNMGSLKDNIKQKGRNWGDPAVSAVQNAEQIDAIMSGKLPGYSIPEEKRFDAAMSVISSLGKEKLSSSYIEEIFNSASAENKAKMWQEATRVAGHTAQTDRWEKVIDSEVRRTRDNKEKNRITAAKAGVTLDTRGNIADPVREMQRDMLKKQQEDITKQEKAAKFLTQWGKENGYNDGRYILDAALKGVWDLGRSTQSITRLPILDLTNIEDENYLRGAVSPLKGIIKNPKTIGDYAQNILTIGKNVGGSIYDMIMLTPKLWYAGLNAINPDVDEYVDGWIQRNDNSPYFKEMSDMIGARMEVAGANVGRATKEIGNIEQMVIQMAPPIALSFIVGPEAALAASSTAFGVTGAGMYSQAAIDAGASVEDAIKYGIVAGAAEMGTEAMFPMFKGFGGSLATSLGGRIGMGRVLFGDTVRALEESKFANSMAARILRTTIYAGGEATEEMIMEIVNPYLQRATYNPKAEAASLEEIGMAGLYGAAVSAVLHIPVGVMNTAQGIKRRGIVSNMERYTKALLQDRITTLNNMVEMGILSEEEAQKKLNDLTASKAAIEGTGSLTRSNIRQTEGKITGSGLGRVYSSRTEANDAVNRGEATAVFMENGEAKVITKSGGLKTEGTLTPSEKAQYAEKSRKIKEAKSVTERSGYQLNVRPEIIEEVSKLSTYYGRDIIFYEDKAEKDGVRGYAQGGRIYLNTANDTPAQTVIAHEMAHEMKGTKAFDFMLDEVKKYYSDSYEAKKDELRGFGYKESELDEEVLAHFVEQKLMVDEAWINSFLSANGNKGAQFGNAIIRGINNIIQKGFGGKEQRFLANVRTKWLKALKEESRAQKKNVPAREAAAYAQGQGYDGYSMSVNAREAYERGEKPKSKWTKKDILAEVAEIDETKVEMIRNVKVDILRDKLLDLVGWHHTSSRYNKTNFYVVDERAVRGLTEEKVASWTQEKKEASAPNSYRGDFKYLEWSGTRRHPKATEKNLTNVNIEERGSFYIVTDDNGNQLVRKKIGSNGTYATSYAEEERRAQAAKEKEERRIANSTEAANALYSELSKKGMERSYSGNIYERGRKPSRYDYEKGIENFFREGEQRLAPNDDGGYQVETFTNGEWVSEDGVRYAKGGKWALRYAKGEPNSRDSAYMKAVEEGDMETATKLVEEAAKMAGYDYKRNTTRRLSPKNNDVDFFMFAEGLDRELGHYGDYSYFAHDDGAIYVDDIRDEIRDAWASFTKYNYFLGFASEIEDDEINPPDIVNSAGIWDSTEFINYLFWDLDFFSEFTQDEYPAIRTDDGLIVFGEDYKRIKSADPVTYDDEGNVIPLSERFSDSDDIRWAKGKRSEPKFEVGDEVVYTESDLFGGINPVAEYLAKDDPPDKNRATIKEIMTHKFSSPDYIIEFADGRMLTAKGEDLSVPPTPTKVEPDLPAEKYFVGDTVDMGGERGMVVERLNNAGNISYTVELDDGTRRVVHPEELTTNVTPQFTFDELPPEEQSAFEEPPEDYDFFDDDDFLDFDDDDAPYESPRKKKKRKKRHKNPLAGKLTLPRRRADKSPLEDDIIREFLEVESEDIFDTGEDYSSAVFLGEAGISYSKDYARNFDEASRGNKDLRDWLQRLFVRPLERGKKDYANAVKSKMDEMRKVMKELGIKKGSAESAAIQWYGENFYTDENGKRHKYTLEDLKAEFPEKWEQIKEAAEWFRKVYDEYLQDINEARAKIYPDPIGDATEKIEDYKDKIKYYGERIEKLRGEIRDIEKALAAKRMDYEKKKDGTKVKEKLERSIRYNERRVERRYEQIEDDIIRKRQYEKKLERVQRDVNKGDALENKRIVPRRDYFHHFQELRGGLGDVFSLSRNSTEIDPRMEGTSEFTQPKSKFSGITLHRRGGRYTPDAIGGMVDYIQVAEYMIHIDPVVSLFRGHIKGISEATAEERNANKFIRWLVQWTNDLAGKTNTIDRFVQDRIGRNRIAVIKRLNSRAKANAVVGNLNSAFAQFFNFPNLTGYVHNPAAYIGGLKDIVQFICRGKEARMLAKESGFLNERYLDDCIRQFDQRIIDHPVKLATWTLMVGDRYTTVLIWFTAYHDGLRKNVDDPIEYADDITRRSVAGRGIGEIPLTQKSIVTQVFAPFQIEVNNAWQLYKEKVKGVKNAEGKKGKAEAAYGFASILVMNFILNTVTDMLIHRRVVFDPLFVFFEWLGDVLGYGDDDEEEEKGQQEDQNKFMTLLGREIGEVFSSMPFGSLIAYYAIENDYMREQFFGDNDPTRYGVGNAAIKPLASFILDGLTGKDISDDFLTVLMTFVPPVGGKQIERIVKGLEAEGYLPDIKFSFKNGLSAVGRPAASYNTKGLLQFPLEDFKSDPLQALVGIVFGKYATDAGQKYLGKDYSKSWWLNALGWNNIKPGSALSERATEAFNKLVKKGSDRFAIFDTLNELRGAENNIAKREVLINSGLADEEIITLLLDVVTNKDNVMRERDKLNSIYGKIGSVVDYLKIRNVQAEIDENENLKPGEKAMEFINRLIGMGLPDDTISTIKDTLPYWTSVPANTDRIDKLLGAGLDSATAMKVTEALGALKPEDGKTTVSELQKVEAISSLGLDKDAEREALRSAFSSDEGYAKYILANDNGISSANWIAYKKALAEADANNEDATKRNGSYDAKEKEAALNALGLSAGQSAVLWQISDNQLSSKKHDAAWKGERNPYDKEVGTKIAENYASAVESVKASKPEAKSKSNTSIQALKKNAPPAYWPVLDMSNRVIDAAKTITGKFLPQATEEVPEKEAEDIVEEYLPVGNFKVSSEFGVDRGNHVHSGIDLAVPVGTNVASVKDGVVTEARNAGGYGYRVVVDHGNGIETTYNHLSDIGVSVGEEVTAGQTIAKSGNTGHSTGPHLHFEVRVNGKYVDPRGYFDFGGGKIAQSGGEYTSKMSGISGGSSSGSGSSGSGRRSGSKGSSASGSRVGSRTRAVTEARQTAREATAKRSSEKASSGNSTSKTNTQVASRDRGTALPTAAQINKYATRARKDVTGQSTKAPSYAAMGTVMPTAKQVVDYARVGYGAGTSSTRRTARTKGRFWDENVLG